MFTEKDLENWISNSALPLTGKNYLRRVFHNPPSRSVTNNILSNVTGQFPSKKMGVTVQYESHTGERLVAIELEYEADVLAYWDQAEPIYFKGHDKRGRHFRARYTADFLIARSQGLTACEVKPLAKLEKLCLDRPTDWVFENGQFTYLPAAAYFAQLGIGFTVIPIESLNPVYSANLELMLRCRYQATETYCYRNKIERYFKVEREVRAAELLQYLGTRDMTPIIQLIDQGYLHSDLNKFHLADSKAAWVAFLPEDVGISSSAAELIQQHSDSTVASKDAPSSKELIRIGEKLNALENAENLPKTTRWRYEKALKEANGNPKALMSRYDQCGSRGSRLHLRHEQLITDTLKNHFASETQREIGAVYDIYVRNFENALVNENPSFGQNPVCLKTFRKRSRQLDQQKLAESRGGRRAARSAASPTLASTRALKPKRAFQEAHVDHWLADIFVAVMQDGEKVYAVRPWFTFLIDTATGALLGFSMSLKSPSSASWARALRDVARRHGRLMESVVSDAGADFRANHYFQFLAWYNIERKQRPVAAGRWGSEVERVFGHFEQKVLGGLPGKLKSVGHDRSRSKQFTAHEQACIEPAQLHRIFQRFVDEWFNAFPHGESTLAPVVDLAKSLEQFSFSGLTIENGTAFQIDTAIPRPKTSYRLDPARGFRSFGRWYVPESTAINLDMKMREVRIDPENGDIAYALFGNQWINCYTGQYASTINREILDVTCESMKRLEGTEARIEIHRNEAAARGNLFIETDELLEQRALTDISLVQEARALRPSEVSQSINIDVEGDGK